MGSADSFSPKAKTADRDSENSSSNAWNQNFNAQNGNMNNNTKTNKNYVRPVTATMEEQLW